MQIDEIQRRLVEHEIDGWLLYDNRASNRFVRTLLQMPEHIVTTRRFFYWIPAQGEPIKIVHRIEAEVLNGYPGETRHYLSWSELEEQLAQLLSHATRVAMEYSPKNGNPYVSVVDAGTIELVRSLGPEVISSDDLLQHFTSVLSEEQLETHRKAAKILNDTLANVWEMLGERLRQGKRVTDYDVQRFILSEFTANNCIAEAGPICSVNADTASPHHIASKERMIEIQPGDFILVGLWCKENLPQAIYADMTRVAVASSEPTPKQSTIFSILHEAQQKTLDFVLQRIKSQQVVRGYEVDDICRNYIVSQGYGDHVLHRTGHNIDTQVHGAGAHLDNLETSDRRKILCGTCFSIEPGIYLPDEFGIRLGYNVLVSHQGDVEVTGGIVNEIVALI